MTRFLLPLAIFLTVVAFLYVGLNRDPREVPSPLIGKTAPAFELPILSQPEKRFAPADMKGKVWLLNVWASWCVSCREEHPVLVELAGQRIIPVVGLNYKDKDAEAKEWLRRFGNPYDLSAVDAEGRIGIDYGVYGVPETYLIDGEGVIRYKQVGALTPAILEQKVLPLARMLRK